MVDRHYLICELEFRADDRTERRRRDGRPAVSQHAIDAMREAVEAFRSTMAAHGYEQNSVGYGALAEDYSVAE